MDIAELRMRDVIRNIPDGSYLAEGFLDGYVESNSKKEKDIKIIYDIPKKGSDNKLITFIHPTSTPGILIELCQSI